MVAVVVVTHDSGGTLAECLRRVLAADRVTELVVVDNASRDGAPARAEFAHAADARFRVLRNAANPGFATACNQGAAATRAPWLLFLNPDCFVAPDTVARLLDAAASDPTLGVLGADVRDARGAREPAARRREPTLARALAHTFGLARLDRSLGLASDATTPAVARVDAVSGALMLVPRAVFDALGGFDAGYRLHCEDLDLCRRARDAGLTVAVANDVTVVHAKGGSSGARPLFVRWHKHRGMWRYYRKFDGARDPVWKRALVFAGLSGLAALRLAAALPAALRAHFAR
jgi:N-acetylglucosaminyl-diphospho-decaprenol L-rhamnosyltransferase